MTPLEMLLANLGGQGRPPLASAAGPQDPLQALMAGMGPQEVPGPGAQPLDEEQSARARLESALQLLQNSNVDPEKIGWKDRIFRTLADAAAAKGAGLQGRAAPPSTLEALRRRRLMAAERESQTKRQTAAMQAQLASGDLSAARQDRRADETFTRQEAAADRRFRMGQEAQAERDEKMREWTVKDIATANEATLNQLREQGRQRMAELDKRLAANDPAAQREAERNAALGAQRTQIARRLLFEEGKRGKLTTEDIGLALDEYELVLDEAGIDRGSPEYAEELTRLATALYRHRAAAAPQADGGGFVQAVRDLRFPDPENPRFTAPEPPQDGGLFDWLEYLRPGRGPR